MSNFNKRIRLLRTTYKLTTRELAMILNIKPPSITLWENGKTQPTLEMFERICNLFAVSSDFMLGYSQEAYTNNHLMVLEDEIINYQFSEFYSGIHKDLVSDFPLPKEYIDIKLRLLTYSKGIRANIIFLANMYISYRIARYKGSVSHNEARYCIPLINNPDLLKKYKEEEYLYICRFNDSLFNPRRVSDSMPTPFYDLEALYKKSLEK